MKMPDEKLSGSSEGLTAVKQIKKLEDLEQQLKSLEEKGNAVVRQTSAALSESISGVSAEIIPKLVLFAGIAREKSKTDVSFVSSLEPFVELSKKVPEIMPQLMSAVNIVDANCIHASSLENVVRTFGRLELDEFAREDWIRCLHIIPGRRCTKEGNVEFSYHDENYGSFFNISEKHLKHPTAQKRALLGVLPRYEVFYALDFLFSIVDNGTETTVNSYATAINNCTAQTQRLLAETRNELKRKYKWDAGRMAVFDRLLYNEVILAADVITGNPEPVKKELLRFCSFYTAKNINDTLEFLRHAVPILRKVGAKIGVSAVRSVAQILQTSDTSTNVKYLSLIETICGNDVYTSLKREEYEKLVSVATAVHPVLDRQGTVYFNDVFTRIFELQDNVRNNVIQGAGKIVSGLKRKDAPAGMIKENVVGYFERILSDPAGSATQLSTCVDGKVLPYMSLIAAHMPSDIGQYEWKRLVEIVGDKHKTMVDEKAPFRSSKMEEFVRDMLIRFGAMSAEQQRFFFQQLDYLKDELHWLRTSYIAEKILPVAEQAYGSLCVEEAELVCAMTKDLSKVIKNVFVSKGENHTTEPLEELPKRINILSTMPEQYRRACISCARRITEATSNLSNNPADLRKTVETYFSILPEKVALLKQDFEQWLAFGIAQSSSIDSLFEYMTDDSGYFDNAHITDTAAVRLEDVSDVLQHYAKSLTGTAIVIQKFPNNELSCSMDGNKFFLPGVVKVSRDSDRNFSIYKALASYQAGMIEAGTYVFDAETLEPELKKRFGDTPSMANFVASYENPDLIKSLFEIAEFERIDKHLRSNYPGLKKNLDFFRRVRGLNFSPQQSNSDLQLFLNVLYQKLMMGSIGVDLKKAMSSKVETVVDNAWNILVAEKKLDEHNVNRSLWLVDTLYTLAGCFLDINAPVDARPETGMAVTLENISHYGNGAVAPIIALPSDEVGIGRRFRYDEWDVSGMKYRQKFVQLFERTLPVICGAGKILLDKDSATVQRLRKHFEQFRPEEHSVVRKMRSGDVDYDAVVKARAEMNAGITPSDKIYMKELVNRRSVSAMVISELSGSLRRFFDLRNPNERLIDVVKQSELYFAEAISVIGDPFAIAGYSGETAKKVEFYLLKDFDASYDESVRDTIASLKPLQQNRDGAGIRHAVHLLSQRPEKTKLLIYLMEGVPHDFDYENSYAIEDTKKAVIEAKRTGCIPVVLAYGPKIDDKMRSIGQHAIYREVRNPKDVATILPNMYARITV